MALTRLLAALLSCCLATQAGAQGWRPMMTAPPDTVPLGINYQGRLESMGFPFTGTVTMVFELYGQLTGGVRLWYSPALNVEVRGGIFAATLDIPKEFLMGSTQKYFEVIVDGQIVTPRDPVRSVPYAKVAESVEGSIDISTGGLKFTTAGGDALVISTITCLGCVGVGAAAAAGNRLNVRPWPEDQFSLVVSSQNGTTLLGVSRTGALSLASPLGGAYGGTGADLSAVGVAGGVPYFSAAGTMGGATSAGAATQVLRSGAAGAPSWMTFTSNNTANSLVSRTAGGNFNAGTITANLTGGVSGTATYATDLVGGLANQIPYQTNASATGFIGGAIGDVLILTGGVPTWGSPAGLPAATADDLTGGSAGELPYQNANNDTLFLTAGNLGQVLRSGGPGAPSWIDQNTLAAGAAGALASNGSNCAAGSSMLGLDAAGAAEGCFDVTEPAELTTHEFTLIGAHGADTANTADAIVRRDAFGNFSAGTVTAANWSGTADTAAALAANGSNCAGGSVPLGVDASGVVESCFDAATQAETDAHTGGPAHGAASASGADTIVLRDGSGNFSAGMVTAALNGNANTMSALAANGTNCASGSFAGGLSAAGAAEDCTDVAETAEMTAHGNLNGGTGAHGAASANSASAIVARTAGGAFSAGTITAALSGTASSMTRLVADGSDCAAGIGMVGVTQAGVAEGCYDVTTQAELDTHTILAGTSAHGAASANTASAIVARDPSGNFSAGTITAALNGNANTATALAADPSNCAAGNLPQGVNTAGVVEGCFDVLTQAELNTHASDGTAHGATSGNTANLIVQREGAGAFTAGMVMLTGFLQTGTRSRLQLQALAPAVGQIYFCSNCINSVNLVIATGTANGNFANLGNSSVQW